MTNPLTCKLSKCKTIKLVEGKTRRRSCSARVYLIQFLLVFVIPSFGLARCLQEALERWLLSRPSTTHDVCAATVSWEGGESDTIH